MAKQSQGLSGKVSLSILGCAAIPHLDSVFKIALELARRCGRFATVASFERLLEDLESERKQ